MAESISELYALGGSVDSVKRNLEALGELNSVVLGDVAFDQNIQDWCTYDVTWDFGHAMLPVIKSLLDTFVPECDSGTSGGVKPMKLF